MSNRVMWCERCDDWVGIVLGADGDPTCEVCRRCFDTELPGNGWPERDADAQTGDDYEVAR